MKQCRFCFLTYDDAYKYTSCPHMPIGAGPAPFHPVTNPGGYCKEHDLFAHIRLPNGEPFPKEEKMPTDKPPESAFVPAYDRIEGRPSHGCGGVQPFPGRAVNVIEGERKGMAGIEGEETPLHQDFYRPKTLGIPPATEGPFVPQEVKADRFTTQEESDRLPRSASYLVRRAVNRLYFNPRASDDREIATKALLALDQLTGV